MSHPAYSSLKRSNADWIGAIPSHWTEAGLKRRLKLITAKAGDEGTKVALENIESGTGRYLWTETEYEGEGTSFQRGDLLFGKLRPYLAKVLLADASGQAVGDFHVLRPSDDLDGRFALYYMLSRDFIAVVDGSTYGAKMPRASWDFMSSLPLPLPPLSEQTAIAAFLDRETGKIDALVEEQKRLIELLKEKRQAVISHAVTKGLDPDATMKPSGVDWVGEVPEHWEIVPLNALFHFVKRQDQQDLEILSVYRDHGVVPKSSRDDNINKTPEDLSKYQTVKPGDLVVNKMKAWQGSLGVSSYLGITSPDYAVFEPRHAASRNYLNLLLRCSLLPTVYRSISNGIRPDQWRIEPDKFKGLHLPLPPRDEQENAFSYLSNAAASWDALSAEAEAGIQLLNERRSAIISAAVTGQIDVREVATEREDAA